MDKEQYKNMLVSNIQQSNCATLINELATALVKNEEQVEALTKLQAELAELKKPIAEPVLNPPSD